jgi:hypothetical protein
MLSNITLQRTAGSRCSPRPLSVALGRRERVIRQWRVTEIVIAYGDNGPVREERS